MFNRKNYIYFTIWFLSILIAIIWTYENFDKVDSFKEALKINKTKIENFGKDKKLNSAYYALNLKSFKIPVFSSYGGIESLGKKILYISGNSEFFQFEKINGEYKFKQINLEKIKNNKDAFIKTNEKKIGKSAEEYSLETVKQFYDDAKSSGYKI